MKKSLFTEKNNIYLLSIPFTIILFVLVLSTIILILTRNDSAVFFVLFVLLFLAGLLNFYQFKIEVTTVQIIFSFGIGLIKKKYDLKDIDLNSFSTKKIPWFYGAGWRYDLKGNTLFNAKPGTALTFKFEKDSNKRLMVVTKNIENLKNAIIKAEKSNDSQ